MPGRVIPVFLKAAIWSWQAGLNISWHSEARHLVESGEPVVYALWHGRLFATLIAFQTATYPAVMISHSRDGEFVTQIARGVGYKCFIRGSYGRGGHQASKELLDTLKERSVLITVDGPRGPRYQFKPALVKVLAKTGAPIIPIAATCSLPLKQFTSSWDHFVAPGFFSPIKVAFGPPQKVDACALDDTAKLEAAIEALNQSCQAWSEQLDSTVSRVEFIRHD